ncbi:hypothetical protein CPAR01_01512 [Colletotrichum paranaense]|uniref:Uncharacterized protein n=1 Tax=Colletotrichum paranaense TaxID=1914294 RepID=A0ABQ9T712_9PEZI|nr:uncharacterized protein CPAR01_01512 [Colletotrichum paranaense]KAK1547545.1 hypothetical protein CPAR01_01512 [Colletotrichum paranaense]
MPLLPSINVSMKRVESARVSSRLPFQGLRARLMMQDTPGQDRHAQPQSNASLQASNLPSPGPSPLAFLSALLRPSPKPVIYAPSNAESPASRVGSRGSSLPFTFPPERGEASLG